MFDEVGVEFVFQPH